MPLPAGTRLGPYEIGARIGKGGKGGKGGLHRARDTKLDRRIAVKVRLEELANDSRPTVAV